MRSARWICLMVALISLSVAADDESGIKKAWKKTKETTKRAAKKVKEAGKEVGHGVQEIFDPNDEDLQAERRKKKK